MEDLTCPGHRRNQLAERYTVSPNCGKQNRMSIGRNRKQESLEKSGEPCPNFWVIWLVPCLRGPG